jgi:hypothetical protein
VQLVAVDTLAMKNRSPVTAVQQLFADTAPALVANIQHNKDPLLTIRASTPGRAVIVPNSRIERCAADAKLGFCRV